jgi:hypothetical protein
VLGAKVHEFYTVKSLQFARPYVVRPVNVFSLFLPGVLGWFVADRIWFSGPVAERLLPGLVSERKRTFDQLFRSLQNPRAAVNAVLGFSRWFGRVLGFRVAGPGARKQERAVSEGSLGAQKGW